MRLGYLCADRGVPVAGTKGASVHLRAVVTALSRRGHRVPLLTGNAEGASKLPFEVHDVGFDRTLKKLRRALAEKTGDPALAAELQNLMLNRRTREVLESLHAAHPFDALYERYSLWCWEGLRFSRAHHLPFILEVNAPLVDEQRTYRSLQLPNTAHQVAREVIRGADIVVVPSSELLGYIGGVIGRKGPIEVIPNGVDLEQFEEPIAPQGNPWTPRDGSFVVVFLGSLKPWHGIEVLLDGFRRLLALHPAAQLLVVGDGPLRGGIDAARATWGANHVHMTGAVPHSQVPYWLSLAHVGVAAYPALESFYFSPLKVVEYMAAGLPVVASRTGQLRQTVHHRRTGLLIEPGDPEALAEALAELAKHPEVRCEMGLRARRHARARHGWDQAARAIERLLSEAGTVRSRRVSSWA